MSRDEGVGDENRSKVRLSHRLFRPNILPLALIAANVLCFLAAGRIFDFPVRLSLYAGKALFVLAPVSVILALCAACLITLFRNRPDRPTAFLRDKLMLDWKLLERAARGLPLLLCMTLMFSAFTSYKAAISKIVPFYADPYAVSLDLMIHGTDPWRLLQPFIGFPVVTEAINFFYNLWFFVMYAALSLGVFMLVDERLRSQYLAAFILSWSLIGGLAATLFSSAGPCYYSAFYAGDPFAELFAYLDHAKNIYPVVARNAQAMLLEKYKLNQMGLGAGISAIPSMHIAVVVLNGIFLFKINRLAGWAAWIFAVIIFVGSVHLGWHYAVDGYAAALLVVIIWFAAGKLVDWSEFVKKMPRKAGEKSITYGIPAATSALIDTPDVMAKVY